VSPVKYGLDFYIPEEGILHSHRCENLESYKMNFESIFLINYFRFQKCHLQAPSWIQFEKVY
jgi:hypothetical protein